MLRKVTLVVFVTLAGCGALKPIAVAPPSWPGLMAGHDVYSRLVSDQAEIRKAPRGKNRTAAYQAYKATESAWETYSSDPTVDHWNNLQTVGSNLDAALRRMRGQQIGAPGTLPPCVTGKESWCRQPRSENAINLKGESK